MTRKCDDKLPKTQETITKELATKIFVLSLWLEVLVYSVAVEEEAKNNEGGN